MDALNGVAPGSVAGTAGNPNKAAAPLWLDSPSNSSIDGNALENSLMLISCGRGDVEGEDVGDGGPNEVGDTNEWIEESVRLLASAGATKLCWLGWGVDTVGEEGLCEDAARLTGGALCVERSREMRLLVGCTLIPASCKERIRSAIDLGFPPSSFEL
jgi:hypothetical protein